MLERLKQLFAPKRRASDVEIETERVGGESASLPVGPMVSGVPPSAPVRDPSPDEPEAPR
jgi:hypothetical protein